MLKSFIRIFVCLAVLSGVYDLAAESRKMKRLSENLRNSRKNCDDNLNALYNALRNYADMNNGQLPDKDNLAGLQELLQHGVSLDDLVCPSYKGAKYKNDDKKKKKKIAFREENSAYIYFGGINLTDTRQNIPKLIVMCDKFWETKNDHFNILTADGKVEAVKQEKSEKKISAVTDLIDYLQKKYKYPQDIYRALRLKAENIDSELRRNRKK